MTEKTGVFICDCGGTLFSEKGAADIASRLVCNGETCAEIFHLSSPCSDRELASIAEPAKGKGLSKILYAGCSPVGNPELYERIAQKAGLAPSAVYGVNLRHEKTPEQAAAAIDRGWRALTAMPSFEVRNIPLSQSVLVVGGGIAGIQTASQVHSLGYATTLVESGEGMSTQAQTEILAGVEIYTGSRVIGVSGHIGSFEVGLQTPGGEELLSIGAIVLAMGTVNTGSPDGTDNPLFEKNFAVSMADLEGAVSGLRRKNGARPIGLLLDFHRDETKASMATALDLCLRLQRRGARQMYLFCREAKIAASGLASLYDEVREAGVSIVKYEGEPQLTEVENGVVVACRDAVLREDISLHCDFVGISARGIGSGVDADIVSIFGVSLDDGGHLQNNNINLFPERTNRPGIFVVGSCRGQDYIPQVVTEASATALTIHSLLEHGSMEVEVSGAVVDANKCILCLTCVRSCPFKAMRVDREKGAAASVPEACQKCGICAGECPARAIELPVFSDQVLLSQLETV
jgi:heterodisulfide reductase subunit A-like polyferredoxin